MNPFNQNKRSSNVMKSASIGMMMNIAKVLMGFAYRTIFLSVLSASYLGINGLFTNILQVLSLAELGITTAITYRFYEPISRGDVAKVGRLMNFFRDVYRAIAAVIFIAGLALVPLMPHLINDTDTVPEDINLTVVYILFLLNTVSSYLFSYKLTLLGADQKNYQLSMVDAFITLLRYVFQTVFLITTANYTLTLAIGIVVTLVLNYVFSMWVSKQYRDVFLVDDKLEKEDQKVIFDDTKALMYHKVGSIILTGTDSAVLTKMVNLVSAGIYSNYSLILLSLQTAMGQLLGNFVSSIGNARIEMDSETYYGVFRKMNFFGLWVTGLTSVCLFVAVDDFIEVWLGADYVFSPVTTAVLCIQYYLLVSSNISMSFTNAGGLFVKDRLRPLIEAAINLAVSVVMAKHWGITGVFVGTIVSILLTTFWRIPYVLYKFEFRRSTRGYWADYAFFAAASAVFCTAAFMIKSALAVNTSWLFLFAELIISAATYCLVMMLICRKREEYAFIKGYMMGIAGKVFKRFG